jgi:hypothetical protein
MLAERHSTAEILLPILIHVHFLHSLRRRTGGYFHNKVALKHGIQGHTKSALVAEGQSNGVCALIPCANKACF